MIAIQMMARNLFFIWRIFCLLNGKYRPLFYSVKDKQTAGFCNQPAPIFFGIDFNINHWKPVLQNKYPLEIDFVKYHKLLTLRPVP
jgi:hypothetical protein